MTKSANDDFSEKEAIETYRATLDRVLATPPDHKTNPRRKSEKARETAKGDDIRCLEGPMNYGLSRYPVSQDRCAPRQ